MDVGKRIRSIRMSKQLTQEQLAEKSGIAFSTIGKYECGDRKPKSEQRLKIADALGISVNVFLDLDIKTVSDLLSLLFKMDEQIDITFSADQDDIGNYIPDTVQVSFENPIVNEKLCAYMTVLKQREELLETIGECSEDELEEKLSVVNQNISDYGTHLLDDITPIKRSGMRKKTERKNERRDDLAGVSVNKELQKLLLDCTPSELEFLVKTIGFLKQTLREQNFADD
jgi:transcriptional regulator with XRE-family HTH domain